ncbi:MAG: aminopeptidase [Clostridiales bacterium]|nr:aminopeptidase [Clostridiales bacterium]
MEGKMTDLLYKRDSAWLKLSEEEKDQVFSLADAYKLFLDVGKTERESADEIKKQAEQNGYVSIESVLSGGQAFKPGLKVYAQNKGKSIILIVVGKENISSGMNIVGGHIDSPRLDLKQVPFYEDSDIAMLKTHYYGGIKKYQWASLPLALHGIVMTKDNKKVNIVIGEDETDPVFFISDLLPHLAKDQMQKKASEFIEGEDLNLIIGNIPSENEDSKEKVKENVLKLINEKYGITEKDFLTAELEVVPAGKARDVGIDRSMISAYGHDDRVCSYAGMRSIFEVNNPTLTAVGMFMDKEEVGSNGNTGSNSMYFENIIAELINLQEDNYSDLYVRRSFMNSKVLSADVNAAYDPNFKSAYDKPNTGLMGYGLQVTKYTGSRGKSSCNDANAEFLSEVRNIFESNGVVWQTGELGKVDQGGGGTIAYILANYGAEVVDCGVPMLSMHAPYELLSKVDLFMAYKGYKSFLNR